MLNTHEQWIEEAIQEGLSPRLLGQKEAAHVEALAKIDAQIMGYESENLFSGLVWSPTGESIYELAQDLQEFEKQMRARWDAITMERKRRIIQMIFSKILVIKAPQGARFSPAYISLELTALGEQLRDLES
jgi:hypothetical protein